MIKRLLLLLLSPTLALAQIVPNGGITQGQVWTVPQWVSAWQSKADTASPAFTGTITGGPISLTSVVTAQPPSVAGNLNPASIFAITADNTAAGTGFIEGIAENYVFGGSSMTGGRIANYAQIQQATATSASNTNRNYVASQGTAYTSSGDGGTNLTTGAKGAYFSFAANTFLTSTATNVFEATGGEIDTDVQTGASVRYLIGWSIVGNNSVQGSGLDAALDIGGGTNAPYGPHVAWNYGIVFDDIHGRSPVNSSSTLLGGVFPTLGTQTIAHGIDLSNFSCSVDCFKSANFSVNGAGQMSANLLITTGTVTANGGLQLPVTTVASLPTCNTGAKGLMYAVSDATAPTYNAALTGGGAVSVPVYCNGTAWTSH